MWENIYKSAVKLKEMALPQKNEGVTSILRSLEHQFAILFLLIIATGITAPLTGHPREVYIKRYSF
jgi:hypothetical protein